ncbi:hypothetical protein ACFQOY_12730 [Enterococcus alcedinis]|uniref:Uncharacterized protein n=1 Tax=Enterococcus alcedinis TaxID=1274384 RepID=A0A917JIN9_9ENTE|nr:hypothetical protein [Enterococcus alcedinis]MBP2103265.1 hypothetical protein [Enterococcus alcedinis]GGI66827.1 hypothetical protein GCM10011482_24810 [Enterococcus alcedinis]
MTDSIDKLNKLAAEEREKKPFSKIDKMEKEFNLDQEPDVNLEEDRPKDAEKDKKTLLDEQSIIELSATQQAKFNNQPPR